MEVRPRRAAEAFWRCEQAFERRTRDMTFFPPPFPPPFLKISFREIARCWMDWGALGAGFRGIGVERLYRIMMGSYWVLAGRGRGRRRARGRAQRAAYVLLVGIMSPELFTRRGWANNSANVHCSSRWCCRGCKFSYQSHVIVVVLYPRDYSSITAT